MENIKFEKQGNVAVISLYRPDKLNALNFDTLCELDDLVNDIRHQRDIRVVVLKGEGKGFCVGADLKERKTLTEDQVRRNVYKIRKVCDNIESLPQPTMAVLHAFAFGGGLELALACDFRYAHVETKMGLTEVSLGIIPGAGGTQRLPRLVGTSKAKELILTAKRFQADEGERIGLINEATDGDAFELALSRAKNIEANAPLAVIQAKYAINKGMEVDSQTGMDIESKAYELLIPTEDRVEALQAFSEKRKPNFKGK